MPRDSPQREGKRSPVRSLSRYALAGGAAGALCALGDFGASWLWLTLWQDRLGLLWKLLLLQSAIGLIAGALAGSLAVAGRALGEARARRLPAQGDGKVRERSLRRWQPVPLLLLASPGLVAVAHLLFSGGKMSRLPAQGALVAVAALILIAGAYIALRLGAALHRWSASGSPRRARWIGAALLGLHFALTKADQGILPKLYDYLHGALSVLAWATAALALAILAGSFERARAVLARRPSLGAWLVPVALAGLALGVWSLDRDPNVRVALFDARASNSRSLLQGLGPVLRTTGDARASAASIARARARRARRGIVDTDGLPSLPEAHVLLVTVDALRADHLGLYGYEREISPNLDRFAEESIVFERAYAQAPHSSYSLCSLMTSEYLHETVDLGHPLPEATLPGLMAEAGYHTAAFFTLGIFHTEGERLSRYHDDAFGFARREHSSLKAERRTDAALEEVDRIVEQGEPPSLLWVHYFDVHEPYEETALGTSELDRYDGEIRNVDTAFERLIREARARFERDVVIMVSADHGEEFRDHGGVYHGSTLYEEQVRVPLIVHVPGLEARRVPQPVELVDVAPTTLSLLDLPTAETMRGDDLRPLLAGREMDLGPAFSAVSHMRMATIWPHKIIANLRFNLFELYDLEADPGERVNLAGEEPERLEEMKGEVYAFLDSLQGQSDPQRVAIDRGRLGDRRAVEPLCALIQDEAADTEMRREAARILARLADRRAAEPLLATIASDNALVSAEAAIALGRQYDDRAKAPLRRLVHAEDPDIRTRAAVSLGRLRDPEAVPALIDALYHSREQYEREEAVRWLGRLRDPRAVEPLIRLIPEFRIRYLTVVALGHIGDMRAYEPLVSMLGWEHHSNIRDNVTRALGQLGDPRAAELLVPIAADEPGHKYVFEALVRLSAIERGLIGGADLSAEQGARGDFTDCEEGPTHHDWDYLGRTFCRTREASATLTLAVPEAVSRAAHGVVAIRLKRADDAAPTEVQLTLDGASLATVSADGRWTAHRFELPSLDTGAAELGLRAADESARVALDHVLLLPSAQPFDPS